jgi:hypothetical protein
MGGRIDDLVSVKRLTDDIVILIDTKVSSSFSHFWLPFYILLYLQTKLERCRSG